MTNDEIMALVRPHLGAVVCNTGRNRVIAAVRAVLAQVVAAPMFSDEVPAPYDDDPKSICAYMDGWNECRKRS